jgi:hypothetical protein
VSRRSLVLAALVAILVVGALTGCVLPAGLSWSFDPGTGETGWTPYVPTVTGETGGAP